jgi:glycosyltransferase involved in cell wall biosynthesis
MGINTCFVYPYSTYGGVERVLLNRGLAFRHFLPDVRADLFFLSDVGGLAPLMKAIKKFGIQDHLNVTSSFNAGYDFVSLIDCPEMVDHCEAQSIPYIMECHTHYAANRRYLTLLRPSCRRIVTPSPAFSRVVREEVPERLRESVSELRNFVPWEVAVGEPVEESWLPGWRGRPVLWLGRMDQLKDPASLLDAASLLDFKHPGEFVFVFCGPRGHDVDMDAEIRKRRLESRTVVIPPIPFDSTAGLLRSVALASGIFVSPSRGESFGLSAAEAICSLLPVLLSDIEAHLSLVEGYEAMFTYRIGDAASLARGIERLFADYRTAAELLPAMRNRFSGQAFVADWNRLIDTL